MSSKSNNGSSSAAHSRGENSGNTDKPQQDRVSAPPLVPVTNAYLEDLSRRIRARPIPWEGYARADLVTDDELKMIRAVDGSRDGRDPQQKSDSTADQGEQYAQLYIRLLAKLTRTDTLQQVLVMMSEMLEGHDERAKYFLQAKAQDKGNTWPWQPLTRLLEVQDDFCQLKAAQLITLLLVSPELSPSSTPSFVLDRLLAFISSLVHSGGSGAGASNQRSAAGAGVLQPPNSAGGFADGNGADVGIQLLEALLRSLHYRQRVWADEMRKLGQPIESSDQNQDAQEGGTETPEAESTSERRSLLAGLRAILGSTLSPRSTAFGSQESSQSQSGVSSPSGSSSRGMRESLLAKDRMRSSGSQTPVGSVGVQMVYQVGFCFWLLSFDKSIAAELNAKFGIIPVLADVARNAVKEKVIRVIVATFRNLVEKAPNANLSALLGAKVLTLMESLAGRKWSDDEIKEDVDVIKAALEEKLKVMSTYEQYISELASGQLTWDNPVHDMDDFWKHNTQRLLEPEASDEFNKGSGLEMLLDLIKPESEEEDGESKNDKPKRNGEEQSDDRQGHGHRDERPTAAPANAKTGRDPTTLAIACNDIGKMLHASPEGGVRKRIDKSGSKTYIMALMEHEDGQVKYHALKTVAKLVSASWRK